VKLQLVRQTYTTRSTIGRLSVDGKSECFTLEDPVRPVKIPNLTAIPAGRYGIEITHSPRFGRDLPLLLDVPGFTGVRIHPGNTPENTEGCILVGRTSAVDFIGDSRTTFDTLFAKLRDAAARDEELLIEIENDQPATDPQPLVAAMALAPNGTLHRITADVLRLRSTPDKNSSNNVVARLPLGRMVIKQGMADDPAWTRVETMVDGSPVSGFASTEHLEAVPAQAMPKELEGSAEPAGWPETPPLYRVTASHLNLRSAPNETGDDGVVAMLPRNQLVARIASAKPPLWWKVETMLHGQKLGGFVHSGFLIPLDDPNASQPPSPIATAQRPTGAPSSDDVLEMTDRAIQLILSFEGMDQPGTWPGEMSGISIGHGYDLGYCTVDQFSGDWGPLLLSEWIQRLSRAIGKRGAAAQRLADQFSDITIAKKDADEVFVRRSLPKLKVTAAATFRGIRVLPPDCQGALASLVYNRGTSMEGDRRREMREIRDCIADPRLPVDEKLERIAALIQSMKRLWPDSRGLRRRRDAEAELVRSSA
jgi:hypothetical protein